MRKDRIKKSSNGNFDPSSEYPTQLVPNVRSYYIAAASNALLSKLGFSLLHSKSHYAGLENSEI